MKEELREEVTRILEEDYGFQLVRRNCRSWNDFSRVFNIPEEFARKFQNKLNWELVSSTNVHGFSEDFIFEFRDRLNIKLLESRGLITQKRLNYLEQKEQEQEFLSRDLVSRFELIEL